MCLCIIYSPKNKAKTNKKVLYSSIGNPGGGGGSGVPWFLPLGGGGFGAANTPAILSKYMNKIKNLFTIVFII